MFVSILNHIKDLIREVINIRAQDPVRAGIALIGASIFELFFL